MPSLADRFLNAVGLQRSFAPFTPDELYALSMGAGLSYGNNYFPQTTMGKRAEQLGQGFHELAAGAYAGNPIVFACMLARAQLFSEARFQFQRMTNGVPGELFQGPSTYLKQLEEPWPGGTTSVMLKEAITDADLGGNAFIVNSGGMLQRLRPDWTIIVAGSRGEFASPWDIDVEIAGYGYKPGGPQGNGDMVFFQRQEVAHFKPIVDPLKRFSGLSWMVPIMREIMGDNAATSHKLNYFENAATPNLAVQFDATMTKAQAQDWKDLFHQKNEGAKNAFKTLFLGGGSTLARMGSDLQQADFTGVQAGGELRIASAAGVPPIVIGLSGGLEAATYSNYGQARRAFADLTMRPLWRDICGALQTITRIPEDSRLWFDDRNISFLQEDMKDAAEIQKTRAGSIRTLVDAGFTAESVKASIIANDESKLVHSGLFSVQLQAPGSIMMPLGEEDSELPVGGTDNKPDKAPPKPAVAPARSQTTASPITGEIRCSSCNRLLAEMATAPYRLSCPRCKNVTSAGLSVGVGL